MPYSTLGPEAFWRTGVVAHTPQSIQLYRKKFSIAPDAKIATAGSCFAQHIARFMRQNGYNVLDTEPAPPGMPEAEAKAFGYRLYSARYGNIYSARQFLQLLRESRGKFVPADCIWEKDGRYFDALRPAIEPLGLASPEEVQAHREQHLVAVRRLFRACDVLIFTFGLTEAWVHAESGTVYPTAPGVIAGTFDPEKIKFHNFTFAEVYEDFLRIRAALKAKKADMKFIVTVSPVPLTATASGDHVLAATTYSKSVLRAVAGQLAAEFDDVDYFPSYELIASPMSKSEFFEPNLRSVREEGVATVMQQFFAEHQPLKAKSRRLASSADDESDDVVCEDLLLEAFAS